MAEQRQMRVQASVGLRHSPGHRVRIRSIAETFLLVALTVAVGSGLMWARSLRVTRTVPVADVQGGAPAGSPAELSAAAAALLEQATAPGGVGYRFEIVQRSTMVAKPGGPLIDVPDPIDRTKSLGEAAEYYVAGLVEAGYVTPDGFYMEMRTGPGAPDAAAEVTKGDLAYRTLVRDGTTFRDDGRGWYATDNPPGIGLDPHTAALLPTLLRNLVDAADGQHAAEGRDLALAGEEATRSLAASAAVKDLPGVIAVDGEAFTEFVEPIELTFDAAGRLTGLLVTARNTNLTEFDFLVVTEIVLRYADIPVGLPDPVPALADPDAITTQP